MLYKKTHRQYLRQWRLGRRFKVGDRNEVCNVTDDKPHTYSRRIWISGWDLITVEGEYTGWMWWKNDITWLED